MSQLRGPLQQIYRDKSAGEIRVLKVSNFSVILWMVPVLRNCAMNSHG